MSTGAAEEWERKHANGWVAVVTSDVDGAYHYVARDATAQQVVAQSRDRSEELMAAQTAADNLVPPHDCTCPDWKDVTARILVQAKCAANHDIVGTYGRRELEAALSAGRLALFCPRCNVEQVATREEQAKIRRRLDDNPS